jgi:taurine dioxygenase
MANVGPVEVGGITITPYSPTIGARIEGINLAQKLSGDEFSVIHRALLDWKVLFFRNQDITTEQHLAFARRFGELEEHPFAKHKDGYPAVLDITHDADSPGFENLWHADVTWRTAPPLGAVLRMIEGPVVGGDTVFADMCAAYVGLPQGIKDRVEGRYARHDFRAFRRRLPHNRVNEDQMEKFAAAHPNPQHPVIRTHPETGRRAIFVNCAFTQEIVGIGATESRDLLDVLYRQASIPEYQVRFRWARNSIAFWDNRSCQHYAVSDYWPNVRRLERVTIIGDVPFYKPGPSQSPVGDPPFRGTVERWRKS